MTNNQPIAILQVHRSSLTDEKIAEIKKDFENNGISLISVVYSNEPVIRPQIDFIRQQQ